VLFCFTAPNFIYTFIGLIKYSYMLLKYNFLLGKKLLEKGVGNELMMRVMRFTKDSR
jgi:hypothetical protein